MRMSEKEMVYMLTTAAAIKLAIAAGCIGGAYRIYSTNTDTVYRSKMRSLFRTGELNYTTSVGKGKSKREIIRYPQVSRVTVYHDCVHVVFVIPDGLDPSDVRKKMWLFEQVFGDNIELSGSSKTFTLQVYHEGIKRFNYDDEVVREAVKGLRLPIYVGKSRQGHEAYDMVDHPHLLIAGETGSGKSVACRSIITTLVKHTKDLVLYCADLKRSEFHVFKGIAKEVVVDTTDVLRVVTEIRKEMRTRGDLLDKYEVAHVDDLPEFDSVPYIVLAVDEVALLKKEKTIMEGIEEISAIGRALGVFLILSMQRPDADVLDGKLKNNLTVRMAFRFPDQINSQIAIGSGEAATIKDSEVGRMYLRHNGLREVQGPYLDLPRAKAAMAPYKSSDAPKGSITVEVGSDLSDVEWGVLDDE